MRKIFFRHEIKQCRGCRTIEGGEWEGMEISVRKKRGTALLVAFYFKERDKI